MKKLWQVIKPIIYFYLIQFFTCVGAIILYLVFSHQGDTLEYDLIYKYIIIAITLTIVPISIYIFKKYYRQEPKINYKKLFLMVPLGIGISWFYNMVTINFQEPTELMNLNIWIIIIYTGILGPISEELLFRYLGLRKAEEVYSKKNALLIITTVFALLHTGIIGILYAFIIGLILGKIYQKEQNIIYPIIMHIIANLASILVTEYNTWMLITSIACLGICCYLRKTIN